MNFPAPSPLARTNRKFSATILGRESVMLEEAREWGKLIPATD